MSHEIRTPMNGILGTLQLLQRDLDDAKNKRQVDNAIYSARSLLRIINDILDVSKIEAQQLTLENIQFSIKTVASAVVSDLNTKAVEKNISLELSLSAQLPDQLFGDPVRVKQILMNLVSNAVKFTERGSVKLDIGPSHNEEHKGVIIDVTDTGIGMSKKAVEELYDRFSQADSSITRKFGGTGLGMSITQNLVALMHGTIRVASTEGQGTKFVVHLPLLHGKADCETTGLPQQIGTPDLSGMTILVAEDNAINRDIVSSMLSPTNADVHFAENGEEAISKFESLSPNLIPDGYSNAHYGWQTSLYSYSSTR